MSGARPLLSEAELDTVRDDPGALFGTLWARMLPHVGTMIAQAWNGRRSVELASLVAAFQALDNTGAPDIVIDYLLGRTVRFPTDAATTQPARRAFITMRALDEATQRIHPAVPTRAGKSEATISPMLRRLRQRRWTEGHYGLVPAVGYVIPRGPLTRQHAPEEALAASGDRLDLQDADDLRFAAVERNGVAFLDAEPADAGRMADRTIAIVEHLVDQGAGLIVLPELCVSPTAVERVKERLARTGTTGGDSRLIVLGSGVSAQTCRETGLGYNECVVIDHSGRELWRQRKMHHFRMAPERMAECGIALAACGGHHTENVATEPAKTIRIRDLPGLGRVAVLICEDFQQHQPTTDVVLQSAPDWVITPILDVGQKLGRWLHQRGIDLGRYSASRFVVACSATLSVRSDGKQHFVQVDPAKAGFGLCLDGGAGLRVKIVDRTDTSANPVAALIPWQPADWPQHRITARPAGALPSPR